MKNRKMTVAFVGCGKFARFFVPLCQNHPNVEKVYVCDLIRTKAEKYAEKFGVEIIDTYEEILGRDDIDCVMNFTQRHLHGEIVALGLLICLIVDEQYDEYIRLREFYKKVELPTIPEDIDISKEQFCSLINNMCDMSDIRHYPYKVTPQMISDAVEILYDR